MNVDKKPDVLPIEDLDFEHVPKCEVEECWAPFGIRLPFGRRCKKPAAWFGILPCCGGEAYCCRRHYVMDDKVWQCKRCSRFHRGSTGIVWRRL